MTSASETLNLARRHAEVGRFAECRALCQQLAADCPTDQPIQLDIGALLSAYGLLSDARACYERAQSLAPTDLRAQVNLANLARDAGNHGEARRLYAELLQRLPDHPIIRRNALTSLEYDPEVSDAERLAHAKAWGEWAITQAGGQRPRPALRPLAERPLRLGYVSADLCQHTVGLFVKDVLRAHDVTRVQVFAYSAGQVKDWVTDEIRAACTLRDVAARDDAALAEQIRADAIDILIDLSGHTAGSRLTVFAQRPAPVMLSWLGYFATIGLPYLDAVLLDDWHVPSGNDTQFVEPILRLPSRFCYRPVPWAPAAVAAPAFVRKGHITFGCFNNSAKFNTNVFDTWARVLQAVPDARLILKWRTFNDEAFRQQVTNEFAQRGITAERIELRGPSFHADLLQEYADLDIALDPFPFTGGLTSCEALWMGVPVVTWPHRRVVSRQTFAFLKQIGLPELAARDADDYVRIVSDLAHDSARLTSLRACLRGRMAASPLCDVPGFTRHLEDHLVRLYRRIEAEENSAVAQRNDLAQRAIEQAYRGQLPEAEAGLRELLLYTPGDRALQRNLAVVLANQNKLPEALALYQTLLADAENTPPDLLLNAAYTHLKAGLWGLGWQWHEARYHAQLGDKLAALPPGVHLPLWRGEALTGKSLLVVGEQGLGDQMMFARYLPVLRQRGAGRIGVFVSPALMELMTQARLADHVYDCSAQVTQHYDVAVFIGSLPLRLDMPAPRDGWNAPYLRPRPMTASTGVPLSEAGLHKIGIVWSGNRQNRDARYAAKYRFFDPEVLTPLFADPHVQCYSLQHGDAEQELTDHRVIKLGGRISSLQDTVDWVAQMDAIVTADTSLAHVAGALGKSVHILS